jgi:hypothetical protein
MSWRSCGNRSRRVSYTYNFAVALNLKTFAGLALRVMAVKEFGRKQVATHYRVGHHTSSVSLPPPLQPLQPSHAFRLTQGSTWSTDTSSQTPVS